MPSEYECVLLFTAHLGPNFDLYSHVVNIKTRCFGWTPQSRTKHVKPTFVSVIITEVDVKAKPKFRKSRHTVDTHIAFRLLYVAVSRSISTLA